ncbi:RNA-binding protein 42 [Nymphaea thermarum]|nr:RNA-binding protein 42 [Nymphaea thermarum]
MTPASNFPVPFHLQNTDPSAQQLTEYIYQNTYPEDSSTTTTISFCIRRLGTRSNAGGGSLCCSSAQQLFQRDAQIITPEAIENVRAALASSEVDNNAETKKKAVPRKAAGQTWEDPTLADWPENDFRLFCGDLGNEVNDDVLTKAFSRFHSFNMARVVRDRRTGKTRGYGFVSFSNPSDLAQAIKETNGTLPLSHNTTSMSHGFS